MAKSRRVDRRQFLRSSLLFGAGTLLSACETSNTSSPVNGISPQPSNTPTLTQTPTPLPSATLTPTLTLTPTITSIPTWTPSIPVEQLPEMPGLVRLPNPVSGAWIYTFPDSEQYVAILGMEGKAENVHLIFDYQSILEWTFSPDWSPLYQAVKLEEIEGLFANFISYEERLFLMPIDPTLEGNSISFQGRRPENWIPEWHATIEGTQPMLIRSPMDGTALRMGYGDKDGTLEGDKVFLEYEEGLYLTFKSKKHDFLSDTYRLIPDSDSPVKAGDPLIWVEPSDDGGIEVLLSFAYDMKTYNVNTLSGVEWLSVVYRLSNILHPENLLLISNGRIAYVLQENSE